MQIIIPMSGFGERFRRAGYSIPKPLIEIEGKPIIAHVIDMFPGEKNFIFICNKDHLNEPDFRMEETLKRFCPTGKIVGISPHKLGPLCAVQKIEHLIDLGDPVIVNYCDFTCYWDWYHFKQFVVKSQCMGAIPAYKGFHPHTLGSTNYAYMLEHAGWAQDIQEKQPYTNNRMEEYASSGTYYFASGKIMLDAFRLTVEKKLNVNGEYYVSLAYKALLEAHLSVAVYSLQHFMQWGTPEDVAEYEGWSAAFKHLMIAENTIMQARGSLIIPMAGLGQRFINEGYAVTKPLILVSGRQMVLQATHDLPTALHYVFVLRNNMSSYREISDALLRFYPNAIIKTLSSTTEGQACTALIGLEALEQTIGSAPSPLTIGACDFGALYDTKKFEALVNHADVDVIVWGVRENANALRRPTMFGWINAENERIRTISVKAPLSSPATDPIVLGTFTFKRAEDFKRVVAHLLARDGRINGEYYLDSCINDAIELGLRCYLFEVDHYLSWGTPNDLKTFEYWQSCFHKWEAHPYQLTLDQRTPKEALETLHKRYQKTIPSTPELR